MKKWFILLYLILAAALSGCNAQMDSSMANTETEVPSSQISQEDCYLCGPNRPFELTKKPHDTVMILCLNTWDLGDTRMYQYGDHGEDANCSDASVLRSVSHGEEECSWFFDSNTGYHTCEIYIKYGESSVLDPAALSEQLCSDCLAYVYADIIHTYDKKSVSHCDVLYDTATGQIHPISSSGAPYHISDFWVYVEHQEEYNSDIVYLVRNDDTTK